MHSESTPMSNHYPTWPQTPPLAPKASAGVGLRVAILVIGALTGAVMLMETMQLIQIASIFKRTQSQVVGGAIVVAMLWIVSMAAAWGAPRLAALLFVATATGAFILGAGSIYGDMTVWGSVAAILAIMSLIAHRQMHHSSR